MKDNKSVTANVDAHINIERELDLDTIGISNISIVPAHTVVILKKEWLASYNEVSTFQEYVDINNVYSINFPSGFNLTKFEIVGFGAKTREHLQLEIGAKIMLRETAGSSIKRISIDDNIHTLSKVRDLAVDMFDKARTKDPDAAIKESTTWKFKIIEYMITDVYNIAYFYR